MRVASPPRATPPCSPDLEHTIPEGSRQAVGVRLARQRPAGQERARRPCLGASLHCSAPWAKGKQWGECYRQHACWCPRLGPHACNPYPPTHPPSPPLQQPPPSPGAVLQPPASVPTSPHRLREAPGLQPGRARGHGGPAHHVPCASRSQPACGQPAPPSRRLQPVQPRQGKRLTRQQTNDATRTRQAADPCTVLCKLRKRRSTPGKQQRKLRALGYPTHLAARRAVPPPQPSQACPRRHSSVSDGAVKKGGGGGGQ